MKNPFRDRRSACCLRPEYKSRIAFRYDARMEKVSPARRAAYFVLRDWSDQKGFLDDLLERRWKAHPLSPVDRRLSQTLVYGVVRRLRFLDHFIDRLAGQGIASLPPPIVDILRLGLFQLGFLDRIPPHAAVSESVDLCAVASMPGLSGLVNALLRKFPARREELIAAAVSQPNYMAVIHSHPDWLADWAVYRFGADRAKVWMEFNATEPETFLHPVVLHLTSPEERRDQDRPQLEELAASRLAERISGALWKPGMRWVRLTESVPLAEIPAFQEGLALVQDLAARQAVRLLNPAPGETVLDLCCAPGGKTIQIADLTERQATIFAVDSNARRLRRVRENLDRVQFPEVEVVQRDLLSESPAPWGIVDAILLDVPCSGLGTLRRKVDLRYRLKPADFVELGNKALGMLKNAAHWVKPGGRIVYSTCTLTEEENESVVDRFLAESGPDWRCDQLTRSPGWLWGELAQTSGEDSDGAFSALLFRSSED